MSDVTPEVKETDAAPKVERKIINSRRLERLNSFKYPKKPTPVAPQEDKTVAVINSDIHENDARLCVSIRLETRHGVIHERIVDRDSYKFILAKGSISEASLMLLSERMAEITASAKKDYQDYFMKKRPIEPVEEKRQIQERVSPPGMLAEFTTND